ncbi:MAG: WecB/TagA/CpsF family glycosyltransferase [Bacteroidota bacterium]
MLNQRVQKRGHPGTVFILGVRVDNMDEASALDLIGRFLSSRNGSISYTVFFVNVHSIHLARRDRGLLHTINLADVVLPDGSGLKIAGKLFGTPIVQNLNGTDFVPRVLQSAQEQGWTIYLLGGGPEVVRRCRENMLKLYPTLEVVGMHPGYFKPDEEQEIIDDINEKKPDILLVALGSPLQEKWIARNAGLLKARTCFAVGGLFDFLSGAFPRAPRWMRVAGLEWLFRFVQDPLRKWQRVAVEIPLFLALVVAKRLMPRRLKHWINRLRLAR